MLTIGQLARRSGVPVRTLRFWSDRGVIPETDRTAGNYRRYDSRTVAQVDLVRTLRELGLGLEDIRLVLERRRRVQDVAAAHILAIDARIRSLRTQRAICTLLSTGTLTAGKATLMNDLAKLSAAERQRMIDEFVDAAFAGTDPDVPGAGIAGAMRTLPTDLPDEPTTDQVAAWVELAELVGDNAFRARVRQMAVAGSRPDQPTPEIDMAEVQRRVTPAVTAGIAPDSAQARRIVTDLLDPATSPDDRNRLADRLATFTDHRVERYWQLLGVLNGWPPVPSAVPQVQWLIAALRSF